MTDAFLPRALWRCLWQPKAVFTELKPRKGASWWPFLVLALSFAVLQWLFFSKVDWAWYQTEYLQPVFAEMPSKDRATLMAEMTPGRVLAAQLGTGLLALIIANALMGFYLSKVTLVDDNNVQGFGDWFGLTWWCNLVLVVPMLAAMVVLLMRAGEIPPGILAPVSLNRLLGLPITHGWYNFSESFSLLLPWKIWLYYSGIRAWTQIQTGQAWLIAALPAIVIYGGWAAIQLI